jgi:hypothetical protein
MAYIFLKNNQGYKIRQINILSLDTFPYEIFTSGEFFPIIFVTLQIKTIKDIMCVLLVTRPQTFQGTQRWVSK